MYPEKINYKITCSFSISICCLASCCCTPYKSTPISSRVFTAALSDSLCNKTAKIIIHTGVHINYNVHVH